MKDALAQIKSELGSNAVIVSTREIRESGYGLMSKPLIEVVAAVDHRVALSRPAWVSALSKKSFSRVSSPILACRVLRSGDATDGPPSNTWAARSNRGVFPSVIGLGWLSCRGAHSAKVLSPLIAAQATCALQAGAGLRRCLLAMLLLPLGAAPAAQG